MVTDVTLHTFILETRKSSNSRMKIINYTYKRVSRVHSGFLGACLQSHLEVQLYLGQMWPAQTPGTQYTCVSLCLFVPEPASQRPSPGPHTSHRLQTSDNGAGCKHERVQTGLSFSVWSFHNMVLFRFQNVHVWQNQCVLSNSLEQSAL